MPLRYWYWLWLGWARLAWRVGEWRVSRARTRARGGELAVARLGCERGARAALGGRPELKCQVPDVGVGSAAGRRRERAG